MSDDNKTNEQLTHEVMELRTQVDSLRRMESAIKEYSASLVQNSATPTFVLDNGHRVTIWNRACEEMTGIMGADIIGTNEQWRAFYEHKRPVLADVIIDGKNEDLTLLYHICSKSKFIPEGLQAEGWYQNKKGAQRNGASLRFRRTISVPVRYLFHLMSRCCHSLIILGASLDASGFTSPRTLSDRCIGHRIVQIAD